MSQGQSLGHVSRWRSLALTPARLLPLVLVELGALWLIVLTGAAVRLTDSGLGCRHWPGCEEGHPLPAKNGHAFIEFGNRLFGAVTIAATLLAWLAARRTPALPRRVVQLALAIFLGTLLQAPIGLLAVASDLRWPIVMLHLLLSIALLGGATVLALEVRAVQVGRVEPLVPLELRRLGRRLHGRVLRADRQRLVRDRCRTALGRREGGRDRPARAPRARSSMSTAPSSASSCSRSSSAWATCSRAVPARTRLLALAAGVFVALLAQMALGELQWRTHLPWGLVLVHVFLAATVWIGTVALATLFWRPNVDLADR